MEFQPDEVPGLLEVLALVPDPRKRQGKQFSLMFVLAVAVACVLAGARNFREIGDQAADLPQDVLGRLGGTPHPLRGGSSPPARNGSVPCCSRSTRRSWTSSPAGGCAALADAREAGAAADRDRDRRQMAARDRRRAAGQAVRRDAARGEGHHRPARHPGRHQRDHPGQRTAGPRGPGERGGHRDAAHAQHGTAGYIAAPEEDGGRGSDYFLLVKGNQPDAPARDLRPHPGRLPP